jgi:hypothetical protein
MFALIPFLVALVAFLRNGACVLKFLVPSVLNNAAFPALPSDALFYDITQIDLLICVTQFMAALFGIGLGCLEFVKKFLDMFRLLRWEKAIHQSLVKNKPSAEMLIIKDGIHAYRWQVIDKLIQSILEISIGVCFYILSAATIPSVTWISNRLVVDALVIMNVALAYFLCIMYNAYTSSVSNATKRAELALQLDSTEWNEENTEEALTQFMTILHDAGYVSGTLHDALRDLDEGYTAIWRDHNAEPELLDNEIETITYIINDMIAHNDIKGNKGKGKAKKSDDDDEEETTSKGKGKKNSRARSKSPARAKKSSKNDDVYNEDAAIVPVTKSRVARSTVAYQLRLSSNKENKMSTTEMSYFLLNCVAFYGYSLSIFAFHYKDIEVWWHTAMKFGMSHEASDAWGSLAGDAAWTIEAFMIMYMSYGAVTDYFSTKKDTKVKKD